MRRDAEDGDIEDGDSYFRGRRSNEVIMLSSQTYEIGTCNGCCPVNRPPARRATGEETDQPTARVALQRPVRIGRIARPRRGRPTVAVGRSGGSGPRKWLIG